jgi:hypothetical protein
MEWIPADLEVVSDSTPPAVLVNARWLQCTRNGATINTTGNRELCLPAGPMGYFAGGATS